MSRRALLTALAALSASTALAACGGDDAGSTLDQSLSYLPADAPVALTISTDIEGEQYQQLGELIERFPGGDQLVETLRTSVEAEGADFEEDVRPLLGSEFVVGAPDIEALESEEDQFVGALPVEDPDAAQSLIDEEGATEAGEVEGATLYELAEGDFVALDEDVVVFADTQERLEAALTQSAADDALDEETFEAALEDLPEEALLRVYADMPTILEADPEAQQAQAIAWVGALETLGLTAAVEDEGLAVEMSLATNPEGLTDDQLPLAPGAEDPPPVVAAEDEIGIGLRDPSQIVDFTQLAAEEAGAGEIALAESQISDRLGIDLDEDVVGQLTGEASLSVGLDESVGFRSELQDPPAFEDTLDQISRELPEAAAGLGAEGLALERSPGGLYQLSTPDGPPLALGVVGGIFVVAETEQAASELAAAAPSDVQGAEGSVTMRADARALLEEAIAPFAIFLGDPQAFLEPLGDLSGSLEADTDGVRGRFTLAVE